MLQRGSTGDPCRVAVSSVRIWASAAYRRLMTIPSVGQLTAFAFVAAVDDPSRIRRSRDIGAYFGLVPRRYQSGEVDYTGGISKWGQAGANAAVRGR